MSNLEWRSSSNKNVSGKGTVDCKNKNRKKNPKVHLIAIVIVVVEILKTIEYKMLPIFIITI